MEDHLHISKKGSGLRIESSTNIVKWNHGTIIRTGMTCKKIPCYMRDSTCRWFIVRKAKIFCYFVMLNICEFSRVRENAES